MTQAELRGEIDSFYKQREQKIKELAVVEGAIQALEYVFSKQAEEMRDTAVLNVIEAAVEESSGD